MVQHSEDAVALRVLPRTGLSASSSPPEGGCSPAPIPRALETRCPDSVIGAKPNCQWRPVFSYGADQDRRADGGGLPGQRQAARLDRGWIECRPGGHQAMPHLILCAPVNGNG